MKAVPVKAHQIASISGARSSDGRFGLLRFVREQAMPDGQTDLWMAVPTNLLPYLATLAVQALPQPQGSTVPNIFKAKAAKLGVGQSGELVLSVTLEKGATLSYRLERGQAEGLLTALQDALGAKNGATPKPKARTARKNGKAKS